MSNFDTLDETTSRNDNDFVMLRQGSSDYKQRRSVLEEGIRAFASNEANQALADARSYVDTQDAATLNIASNADNLSSGIVSTDVLPGATDPQSVDKTSNVKYVFTPAQLYNAANSLLRNDLNLNKDRMQLHALHDPEDYAKPSGWRGFISPDSEHKPLRFVNYFYYMVIARRDGGGGYVGLAVDYITGMIAVGSQHDGTLPPVWRYVWDDTNLPIPTQAQAEDSSNTTPYAWTPQRVAQAASNQSGGVGINQRWQLAELSDTGATFDDGTASYRANNVTYTNTTQSPIQVITVSNNNHSPNNYIHPYVDGVSLPYQDLDGDSDGTRAYASFIVPSGSTYSIDAYFGVSSWAELR